MKGLKSVISSLLAITTVLMSGLFTACSSGNSSTSSTASTAKSRYKIKMVYPYIFSKPNDLTKVQTAINAYIKDKLNASIEFVPLSYTNAANQETLSIASGEQLDLVWIFNNFSTMVAKGQLKPLDSLVQTYGPDIKAQLGADVLKTGMLNGKLYAVSDIKDYGNGAGFVFLKSVCDKYNIDASQIKTLDDVGNVFKTVKAKEPNMTMLASYGPQLSIADYFTDNCDKLGDSLGVLMNAGKDGLKVVDYYETPYYKNLCNTFRRWYQAGYIMHDVSTTTDMGETLMASGKVFATDTNYKPGIDIDTRNAVGKDIVIAQITKPVKASNGAGGASSWGIGTTSKDPEISMQFLNMLYKDEKLVNLFDNGIEGTHYVKVSGSNLIDFPSGVTRVNSGYYPSLSFNFGNEFLSYIWKGNNGGLWKEMKSYNDSMEVSKAYGFNFDASSVKSQESACTNVVNKYSIALGDGQVDVDSTLSKFIQELKAAGIEDIIKAKQTQLTQWAKANHVS